MQLRLHHEYFRGNPVLDEAMEVSVGLIGKSEFSSVKLALPAPAGTLIDAAYLGD
jgi:hypothetical protein